MVKLCNAFDLSVPIAMNEDYNSIKHTRDPKNLAIGEIGEGGIMGVEAGEGLFA